MSNEQKTPFDNFHIMPVNDLKEHIDSMDCWCEPDIQNIYDDDFPPYNIIHRSADGRERRKPGTA